MNQQNNNTKKIQLTSLIVALSFFNSMNAHNDKKEKQSGLPQIAHAQPKPLKSNWTPEHDALAEQLANIYKINPTNLILFSQKVKKLDVGAQNSKGKTLLSIAHETDLKYEKSFKKKASKRFEPEWKKLMEALGEK